MKKPEPMITAIITTYKRPRFLKRAVNSVLKQSYGDFQVCVYDNASDDETAELMQAFVKKDKRVKYHRHSTNIGMMANYEFAYRRINTPFFSFLSDDDYLLPRFYETALNGFQEFPDIAFSACGIKQIDEKGNCVGDPLSLWAKEGYYPSSKGLFEMLKTRWRFPVPTGILFKQKIIEYVTPDFSPDIQLYWDPDYLLRIAAQFPIFISKKCCGVYLAHLQSFASSVYSNIVTDFSNGEKYLKATSKIARKLKENSSLQKCDRKKAVQLFEDNIRRDVIDFLKLYLICKKRGGIKFLSKKYLKYFNFSFYVFIYYCRSLFFVFPLFCWGAKITHRFYGFLANFKRTNKKKPITFNQEKNDGAEELHEYHKYGQQLFD